MKQPKLKVKDLINHPYKMGGYMAVATLEKPFINKDFIWVELRRSKHPSENKRDKTIAFSINDREAIELSKFLMWAVSKRLTKKNVD